MLNSLQYFHVTITGLLAFSYSHCFENNLLSSSQSCLPSFFYFLGNPSVLAEEIYRQRRYGNVKSHIQGAGPVQTPGSTTLMDIHVDEDRSLFL